MSDSRSCGRCIYYNSIINECGEESKCMKDVDEAKYTSYIEGKKQGKAEALNIDLDTPMHFTNEQKAWIKKYIAINGERQRADGAREFAEWLQRNDAFIADAEFDSYKPKLFFSSVESALAEWQKGKENEIK